MMGTLHLGAATVQVRLQESGAPLPLGEDKENLCAGSRRSRRIRTFPERDDCEY
jgi:hypothetical protein